MSVSSRSEVTNDTSILAINGKVGNVFDGRGVGVGWLGVGVLFEENLLRYEDTTIYIFNHTYDSPYR